MKLQYPSRIFFVCLLLPAAVACGSSGQGGGSGGGGGSAIGGGDGGAPTSAGGTGAAGGGGSACLDGGCDPSACPPGGCPEGERCEVSDESARCVPITCAELVCEETEVCEPAPEGEGFVCADNTCASAEECDPGEHCGPDGTCLSSVCVPGARHCEGDRLFECLGDGSGTFERFVCPVACSEAGGAHCTCEDDWDCPGLTECDVDRCVGEATDPSCVLASEPLEAVLPALESGFPWGSTAQQERAPSSPFGDSTQVVMTPLVVNLDDDNGDGRIDERDSPEIVFVSFCGSDFLGDGILRSIHAGGSRRGRDHFATCGDVVWNEDEQTESDALDGECACASTPDLDSTAGIAAGDLDGDGVPEIVAIGEHEVGGIFFGRVKIYDNRGHLITESEHFNQRGPNPSPTLANLDGEGMPEIVVGRSVLTLTHDESGQLAFARRFEGLLNRGRNGLGPISCVADLDLDGRQEIVAGGTAYVFPDPVEHEDDYAAGRLPVLWSTDGEGFCAVADVWGADVDRRPSPTNPLDGKPEVLLVRGGMVRVLRGADGFLGPIAERVFFLGGDRGGAPNVDDFDGDGFPEVGTAGSSRYVVVDFQEPDAAAGCPAWPSIMPEPVVTGDPELDRGPFVLDQGDNPARTPPTGLCSTDAECNEGVIGEDAFACNRETGRCVCLHNGWMRDTQDLSSRVTGSSVFDFNGDGAAEVVYNDECFFRIYGGVDGRLYSRIPSESRTRTEYPVVADVDADGNAEVVFAASNESGYCDLNDGKPLGSDPYAGTYNAGIEVWGDASDLWVPARRIWNQHAYHVTNVVEGGAIPLEEPPSFLPHGGRAYNTYRSNPTTRGGAAPDLQVSAVQLSSPGGACTALLETVQVTIGIRNAGDVVVGGEIEVHLRALWDAEEADAPLEVGGDDLILTLGAPLHPGTSIALTASFAVDEQAVTRLPDRIVATVDPDDVERECDPEGDLDNTLSVSTEELDAVADLAIELLEVGECPAPTVTTRIENRGSSSAPGFVVRYFAGDPASGGELLEEVVVSEGLDAGDEVEIAPSVPVPDLSITLHALVDPDDAVEECDDGNNHAAFAEPIECFEVPL